MTVERSRIRLVAGLTVLTLGGAVPSSGRAQSLPLVTVYKQPG